MSELIDNRAERIRQLQTIIKDLHAGVPEADVRKRLNESVRESDSAEITAMEQKLIAEANARRGGSGRVRFARSRAQGDQGRAHRA